MRKFDTKVQYLKYKVLREVARQAWNDTLLDNVMSIPRELAPRNAETIYCCVYKERAVQITSAATREDVITVLYL